MPSVEGQPESLNSLLDDYLINPEPKDIDETPKANGVHRNGKQPPIYQFEHEVNRKGERAKRIEDREKDKADMQTLLIREAHKRRITDKEWELLGDREKELSEGVIRFQDKAEIAYQEYQRQCERVRQRSAEMSREEKVHLGRVVASARLVRLYKNASLYTEAEEHLESLGMKDIDLSQLVYEVHITMPRKIEKQIDALPRDDYDGRQALYISFYTAEIEKEKHKLARLSEREAEKLARKPMEKELAHFKKHYDTEIKELATGLNSYDEIHFRPHPDDRQGDDKRYGRSSRYEPANTGLTRVTTTEPGEIIPKTYSTRPEVTFNEPAIADSRYAPGNHEPTRSNSPYSRNPEDIVIAPRHKPTGSKGGKPFTGRN